jgi:flavodoxin I
MKILVAFFSETGNTEKVARAIHEEVLSKGYEAYLKRVEEITSDRLNDYDLIFLGSACHSRDLAQPVKQILEDISSSPRYKLAGFVTHATYTSEGDERKRELYLQWASKCIESFERTSKEKEIDFLGFFNCQGAPISTN